MHIPEAIHHLHDVDPTDFLDRRFTIDGADLTTEFAVALASLSGQLEDASTVEDLLEAVRHGESLLSAGIVDEGQVKAEVAVVIDAVMRCALGG